MIDFKMPSLGADMESGTLVSWHVKEGDHVERGDVVADVETQKGIIEIEIWESGILKQFTVKEGQEASVGNIIAVIEEDAKEQSGKHPQELEKLEKRVTSKTERRHHASPLARRLAAEKGIDINSVRGSGPDGVVTKSDILGFQKETAVERPIPTPIQNRKEKSIAMRSAIAAAMSRSKKEIPHYYLETEVDMSAALEMLDKANENRSLTDRILPAALYLKAVALACQKVPDMNGFWVNDSFEASKSIHIGMGISLRQGGLVSPALHDIDKKSVPEIMTNLLDVVARARSGKLKSSEISDATITMTNIGDQGVETVYGIIYPPQVAILGFGKVIPKPWVDEGNVCVKPILVLTLSADHRASDGHQGGKFLNHIRKSLSEPKTLGL